MVWAGLMPNRNLKGGALAFIVVVGILVVIVIAGISIFASSHRAFSTQPPAGQPVNTTVSQPAAAALPVGSRVSTMKLSQIVQNGIDAQRQLNVSYSGSMGVSGLQSLYGLSIRVPINATLMKYNNSTRIDLLASIPYTGNLSADIISINSTLTYACARSQVLPSASGSSSSPGNFTCVTTNTSILSSLSGIGALTELVGNLTTPSNSVVLSVAGNRSYDGLGCIYLSGTGNQTISNTLIAARSTVDYTIGTCLSGATLIPLNLTAQMVATNSSNSTQSTSISVIINEIHEGKPVTYNSVTALP